MARSRSIPKAVDLFSGEVLIAAEIFSSAKLGAEARKKYNEDELKPACLECEQLLIISKSYRERHYFRHFGNSEHCLLKDPSLSEKELEQITSILAAKESDRHKYLKNRIAQLLKNTIDVDASSVFADDKYIFLNGGKRRPDVYCRYRERELVFEIQLSDLSLRYILDRHNFYKNKGIYLIWILDQFDVKGQSRMEKDIKYLSSHQNFLNLDDTQETLHLTCTYKLPKARKGSVITPWDSCSLPLSRLQFDKSAMEAYFFDFNEALKRVEKEASQQRLDIAKEKEIQELYDNDPEEYYRRFEDEQVEERIKESVENVIQQISCCKQQGLSFRTVEDLTEAFTQYEWESLNERLGFLSKRPNGRSLIAHYIALAKKADWHFIYYLLNEKRIQMAMTPDTGGITVLQTILQNDQLPAKPVIIPILFERGYQLLISDEEAVNAWETRTGKMLELPLYRIFNRMQDRSMVSSVKYYTGQCYVLESARLKKITGLRFANWIGLVNHAITTYKSQWSLIEKALRHFQVWPIILSQDKKGTFEAKLIRYREELPDQDKTFDSVFNALFPDLK